MKIYELVGILSNLEQDADIFVEAWDCDDESWYFGAIVKVNERRYDGKTPDGRIDYPFGEGYYIKALCPDIDSGEGGMKETIVTNTIDDQGNYSIVGPGQESSVEITQNAKGEPLVSVKVYDADPVEATDRAIDLYTAILSKLGEAGNE